MGQFFRNQLFLSFVWGLFISGFSVGADECHPESCGGKEQTLCKYSSSEPSSACGEVATAFLTQAEIQEILTAHNTYRDNVASGNEKRGNPGPQPSGNIPHVTWNEKAAEIAQRWANQCNFGHDECRDTEDTRIGQNVVIASHSDAYGSSVGDLISSWYEEVKNFNSNWVSKFQWQSDPQIGHYSQLIWGESTSVGCGLIRFKNDNQWYKTLLVCDYAPTGNWIGEKVYQTT